MIRFFIGLAATCSLVCLMATKADEGHTEVRYIQARNLEEARSRAMLMHELAHGTLQVMHRDFFDDEEPKAIPSASLQDVFTEMSKQFDVQMKWMTVDTDLVNVDHQAVTPFELDAVAALKSGQRYKETIHEGRYEFAGAIRLSSQCLKCHVKLRTSNDDRTAALLISMPIEQPDGH